MNNCPIYIFVTGDRYPNGDAGAIRTHSFAKIVESLGYRPFVIGLGDSNSFQQGTYENVSYVSIRYPGRDLVSRSKGRILFLKNLKKTLKNVNLSLLAGIQYVSGGENVLRYLKKLCKSLQIPLYHDSVEWYSPSEFSMGKWDLMYQGNQRLNTKLIDTDIHVFAISHYLEEAFSARGVHTLRIPVMMDTEATSLSKRETQNEKIRILYAGAPGNKDHLSELIQALQLLDGHEQSRLTVQVIGVTKEWYEAKYGPVSDGITGDILSFEGRKTRSYVLNELKKADFSFLLRPTEERYAQAGFPTKVVEALSSGTPMLCNLSSDLDRYLQDEENSILIHGCTVEACLQALRKVLALTTEKRIKMQTAAGKTAEVCFDWRVYQTAVAEFMKESEEMCNESAANRRNL